MLHAASLALLLTAVAAQSRPGPVLCNCSEAPTALETWTVNRSTETTISQGGQCLAVGNMTSAAIVTKCGDPAMPESTRQWIIKFTPPGGENPVPPSGMTQLTWAYDPTLCLTAPAPLKEGSHLDVEPCQNSTTLWQQFAIGIADGHVIAGPPFPAKLCVANADSCPAKATSANL